jgi:hypothetical protein
MPVIAIDLPAINTSSLHQPLVPLGAKQPCSRTYGALHHHHAHCHVHDDRGL